MKNKNVLVYLIDKHNVKMFKNHINIDYLDGAVKELKNHLIEAKKNPKIYHFLDLETAEIKIEKFNEL